MMTNDIVDFSDVPIGYDFALRPEIIHFLAVHAFSGQIGGFNESEGAARLKLDEHEAALA